MLGHVITAEGIKPDPKKTKAVRKAPPPKNLAELRSFLGNCCYDSKFIQGYANIVEPLRKRTRKETKCECPWSITHGGSIFGES